MRAITKTITTFSSEEKDFIANATRYTVHHFFNQNLKKYDLALAMSQYFQKNSEYSYILKQTFLKGLLPKLTLTKGNITKTLNVSPKVTCELPNQKTDVRFFTESLTADDLAVYDTIKEIKLLSDTPGINIRTSFTNKTPDTLIYLKSSGTEEVSYASDVKSGSNAMKPFNGIISTIFCNAHGEINQFVDYKFFEPLQLQEIRLDFLEKKNATVQSIKGKHILTETINKCQTIKDKELDPMIMNTEIQKELLLLISNNPEMIKYINPSFYSFKTGTVTTVNEIFNKAISPHITPRIFDDYKNFRIFMKQAFIEYNNSVEFISNNVNTAQTNWDGTGFGDLADDIFK